MKKKYFIITLLAILLLPIKGFALGGFSVSSTSVSMYPGETKTINITSDNAVGKLNISSSNSGIASVDTGSIFIQNPGSSGSITITANSIGTATISVVASSEFATMDEEILEGQTKTITVNVVERPINNQTPTPQPQVPIVNIPTVPKSTDASLKNIELSSGSIEFSSDKDTYDLTVSYDVSSIEVKGISNDGKASVKVEGDTNLKEGDNVIKLVVTAEDGTTTKTYTLNIKRENKVLSKNSNIKKLTINNYDLKFNKNKKEYDLTINNEDNLTINVELEDEFAKYEIIGNKKLKNKSVIKIIVTAEDNSSTIYIINIIKEKNKTKELSIALIISLILNTIIIGFLLLIVIKINKYDKNMLSKLFNFKKN